MQHKTLLCTPKAIAKNHVIVTEMVTILSVVLESEQIPLTLLIKENLGKTCQILFSLYDLKQTENTFYQQKTLCEFSVFCENFMQWTGPKSL